ncbi:hydrolase [Candidatus Comchoanobacter bicostacola]|uniref:Hydrolase n=1 Tax=Candidatus Comchoanobacter bicostacola TaxID=2919598 RepID=A0ABY5DIG2_9GAMM|nr:hydrolase [Candidatus Comchoanobacter bicostacola]UTC24393.1 hydrolase [Candidatus Comchoanobacter bicostacola]
MDGSSNSYKPAWWLPNPHLQTLYPFIFKKKLKVPLQQEIFELPDGDFIDGWWTEKSQGPIVILLHGLQGSVDSHYINSLMHHIHYQTNWRALLLHFRGCGEQFNRLDKQYHSGDTEDIRFICNLIKQRNAQTPTAMVGFSLGGNILLKLFGELKQNNLMSTGISVCPPFDLLNTAINIQNGTAKIYEKMFIQDIKKAYHKKLQASETQNSILKDLDQVSTLIELDQKITAPLHGFDSLEEYYDQSSSISYLKSIKKPTLVIVASNDPVLKYNYIPTNEDTSSHVVIETYEHGGHIGFMSGPPHKPEYWLDARIMNFLSEHLPLGILQD